MEAIEFEEARDDEAILRVKSSSSASSLASAISHAVYDGKKVTLRAIGAGAVNQAVKAIAIAQSFVGPRALTLYCKPGFTTVTMKDNEKISAMVFKVYAS